MTYAPVELREVQEALEVLSVAFARDDLFSEDQLECIAAALKGGLSEGMLPFLRRYAGWFRVALKRARSVKPPARHTIVVPGSSYGEQYITAISELAKVMRAARDYGSRRRVRGRPRSRGRRR